MQYIHEIANGTLEDIVNGSTSTSSVFYEPVPNSNFQRFLFSYDSVNKVYTPILFLFGCVGNCLSVTVFCTAPSHRNLSSSFYLSALAISDIGYLLNLLAVWLEDMGLHVITSPVTCPTVMFLGQVTCFLSVWFTTAFTVERFFAVCYPLTRQSVCTVARAKKVILILTLVALLAFSYVWLIAIVVDFPIPPTSDLLSDSSGAAAFPPDFGPESELIRERLHERLLNSSISSLNSTLNWTTASVDNFEATMRVCYVREEYMYFTSIVSYIDSVLTLILPFVIITYLNIRIALTVWKLKDQRQSIVALGNISVSNSTANGMSSVRRGNGERRGSERINLSSPSTVTAMTMTSPNTPNTLTPFPVNPENGVGGLHNSHNNCIQSPQSSFGLSLSIPRLSFSSATSALPNASSGYHLHLGSHSSCSSLNLNFIGDENSSTSMNVSGLNQSEMRTPQRNHHSHHHSSASAAETRITKTLLLVSTVFLVLNLPAHAIRAVAYIQSWWGLAMEDELQALQQWANILFNTNFSVNFLLYCCSGKNFRKSLWNICLNRKSLHRHGQSRRMTLNPGTRPRLESLNPQSSFCTRNRNSKIVIVTSESGEEQNLMEKTLSPCASTPN